MDSVPASAYHAATRRSDRLPCPGSSGVEQWIENPRVGGSIPPPGTILIYKNQVLARFFVEREAVLNVLGYHSGIYVGVPPAGSIEETLCDVRLRGRSKSELI